VFVKQIDYALDAFALIGIFANPAISSGKPGLIFGGGMTQFI